MFNKYLTPKISIRHSPNSTSNLKDKKNRLTSSNAFDLNRIGTNEAIEGGTSATLGITYEKENLEYDKVFSLSAVNIVRDEVDSNLPENSTLGKKQSDIFTNIYYSPLSNFDINYDLSLDNDAKTVNSHSLTNEI